MNHSESSGTVRFGVIEIDPRLRQIRRSGAIVAVEPKPFELIVYLLRHRDRVVRREELMEALWPEVVVSEATLSSAVRRARAVLAPEQERIQGVRKVGYRFVAETEVATDAPASSGETTPYLGRGVEMAALEIALQRCRQGKGSVSALVGDPGIGKSRSLAELLTRAQGFGIATLIGRCYEGEGGQAFWPWVQIFRAFAAGRSEAQLASALGAEAPDIARLTAAVAVAADGRPTVDPEMQRARLLDSVVAVLRRAAQQTPTVLVLDDLHWADSASLTLLRALASHAGDVPLAIVMTHRPLEVGSEHPLVSLLGTLRRECDLQTITLGGLDGADAGRLLTALAGCAVDDKIVAAVFDVTEGNPFFMHEYWRDLAESGCLVRNEQSWQWRADAPRLSVPKTVVEIIARRLQRLTGECTQLLAIAAVIGRDFDHHLVSAVATSTPADTIDLLDAGVQAGVIDEDPSVAGRYRFSHALVRETLYAGMTALRRAAIHRSVGEALENISAEPLSPSTVAELAHHFIAAAPAGGIEKAIAYCERAALVASRACAYDEAVHYLEQAVAFAESRGSAVTPAYRCELQLQLAEVLGCSGDGPRMRAGFERAAEQARAIDASQLLARAAIGNSSRWVPEDQPGVRLLEEALALVPADDTALRAQLSARLAKALYLFDDRERRERLCAEAGRLAQSCGEPRILGDVLADSLEALFHSDSLKEQDDLATALEQTAQAADDARLQLLAGAWQIVNAMRHGDLNDAETRLQEFSRLAANLRQPRYLHNAATFEAALLLARGQLQPAEIKIDAAFALGLRIDEASARWIQWAQLHHLRREQGRFAEFLGDGLALRLPPETPAAVAYERSYRWAAPHVFCELGRDAEAKASFQALIAEGLDKLPPENSRNARIPALFSLADACITIDDVAAAGEIYTLLNRYADQWHVIGWGTVVFASSHLLLGALAATQEDWSRAEDHFAEANRQHEAQQAICGQTRTLFQHARALQRRGRPADVRRAVELIERGLQLADEYGLAGVAVRLRRLIGPQ